jgi:hypothetical protein
VSRDGKSHHRFDNSAPRRNDNFGNTAAAGRAAQPRFTDNPRRGSAATSPATPRRQGTGFALGRGHNSNTNGNR